MVHLIAKAHGKAALITGDTRPVKETLKSLGARWNASLAGWIFQGGKFPQVLKELQNKGHTVSDHTGFEAKQADDKAEASTNGRMAAAEKKKQSDGQPQAAPASKKLKTSLAAETDASVGDGDAAEFFRPLSNEKKRVSIADWKGTHMVDIREWWGDAGDLKPGKKGIALSVEDWEALKKAMPAIDEELKRRCGN